MTNSSTKAQKSYTEQSYNDMPYESYPYQNSAPEKLASLAVLFGMNPPAVETAKVLELGCAAGGNLIPHAVKNPKGKYVGIDLSENQIAEGQAHIKKLGLKNIELKHMSISDVKESFGQFDYIICHGVFSWVDAKVQDKILEIANKNLTKSGVVYISYNTLPGWNMVRTVRDMMLYHSKGFVNSKDKVNQSRALLEFVKDSLQGADNPYAKMLEQEAQLLSSQADHYIAHEHLEENNNQLYFSDFMKKAQENNMQYLSDISVSTMYLGNMPQKVQDKLKELKDIVQTEQYMDFITNRRFRSTLLCHAGEPINRALDNNTIKKFAMSLSIQPEKPLNIENLEKDPNMKFFINGQQENSIESKSPTLTALLYVFSQNIGFPMTCETVIKKANELFKQDRSKEIEADLLKNAMVLVVKGIMDFTLYEKDKNILNLEQPKTTPMIQYQVQNTQNNWVTSINHSPIAINIFDKLALSYMNGKNNLNQITELLSKDVADGKLNISKNNEKIEDPKIIKEELHNALKQSIDKYVVNGILVN